MAVTGPRVQVYTPGQAPVTWDRAEDRPWHEAGPPPVVAPVKKGWGMLPWGIVLTGLCVALALVGFGLRGSNKLPSSVPVLGRDPGVDLCMAIAGGGSPYGKTRAEELTEDSYRDTREKLGAIRNESVRRGAVAITDLAWQYRNVKENDLAAGFAMIGSVTGAYQDLTTGCADLGVSLPALVDLATVR